MTRWLPFLAALALVALPDRADAQVIRTHDTFHRHLVLGANLVVLLGEVPEGRSRLGAGVDAWYQLQWWTQESREGRNVEHAYWANERLAANYGPAAHVWWAAGDWRASVGARAGATHPLRVGLSRGWWPGPGLTGELALAISTAGHTSLDGQIALDGPWSQVRAGAGWTFRQIVDPRLHLGLHSPLAQPSNPDLPNALWGPEG